VSAATANRGQGIDTSTKPREAHASTKSVAGSSTTHRLLPLCTCRYYVSWRNVALNGVPLPDEAMARLQLYAIPSSGRLTLDYVSYQVRGVCVLIAVVT
jgi:hypothetical protein